MFVAFILGLVSSLHCVGMCGPIAMMIPNSGLGLKSQSSILNPISSTLLYNSGRITTYAIYGLVFGLIGRSFAWFGWQQKISITLGVIIILALVLPKIIRKQNFYSTFVNSIMVKLRAQLSKLLFKGNPASLYGIGLLNGLLPCGMVYLALAGAVATGNALNGSMFMALFGLGTLPAMAAISYFGGMVKPALRTSARKLFPAMMVLMATLLILRGLNLGIPYVSPSLNITSSAAIECHD
ncbi:MAG TPA: sulfite exporter TauE/SafE family protein [Chitinophagaceae bacterium]|nr:sulfite exporter TauE/SafE family protein [Chitinophagaceae bacterium]